MIKKKVSCSKTTTIMYPGMENVQNWDENWSIFGVIKKKVSCLTTITTMQIGMEKILEQN